MYVCMYMYYLDQFLVALPPLVGHAGKVRVPLLAVAAHDATVVILVLPQEPLWVVVGVDVDLCQGVVGGWLLFSLVDPALQPRQQQLQSVGIMQQHLNTLLVAEITSAKNTKSGKEQ